MRATPWGNLRAREVECAIQKMRAGHQHHAWAHGNKLLRRAQVKINDGGADDSRGQCGGERRQQRVAADPRQPAA